LMTGAASWAKVTEKVSSCDSGEEDAA